MSKRISAFLVLGLFSFVNAWAQDPPPGFQDQKILNNVLAGNIDTQSVVDTNLEQHVFLRAQFKKVSPEAYKDVSTDFEGYGDILEEVQTAATLKVNADKTEYDYSMDVVFQAGPFPFHVYPEGHETWMAPKDVTSEGKILNVITNYKETFKSATESVRLIPYDGGILVEDEVHVLLLKDGVTAAQVKSQLVNEFKRMLVAFRTKLKG